MAFEGNGYDGAAFCILLSGYLGGMAALASDRAVMLGVWRGRNASDVSLSCVELA